MSKKHFIAIAASLHNCRPSAKARAEYKGWLASVNAIADVCRAANSQFDRNRFLVACGVQL